MTTPSRSIILIVISLGRLKTPSQKRTNTSGQWRHWNRPMFSSLIPPVIVSTDTSVAATDCARSGGMGSMRMTPAVRNIASMNSPFRISDGDLRRP